MSSENENGNGDALAIVEVPILNGVMSPKNVEGLWRIAQLIARSGFKPKGVNTPEQVFVAVGAGLEVGLSPMQSIQNIMVVNGRPSLWGDVLDGGRDGRIALGETRLHCVKDGRRTEEDAAVVCVVVRERFPDRDDPLAIGPYLGRLVTVDEGVVDDVEVGRKNDVRVSARRAQEATEDGFVEDVVRHEQCEVLVEPGSGLQERAAVPDRPLVVPNHRDGEPSTLCEFGEERLQTWRLVARDHVELRQARPAGGHDRPLNERQPADE